MMKEFHIELMNDGEFIEKDWFRGTSKKAVKEELKDIFPEAKRISIKTMDEYLKAD